MSAESAFDHLSATDYDPALYSPDSLAAGIDGLAAWDEVATAQYRDLGFVVIRGALDPATVQTAREAMVDLVMGRVAGYVGVQFESWAKDQLDQLDADARLGAVRKLMHFNDHEPRFKAIAEDSALIRIITRLLGHTPYMSQDMALLKPPGGREKPWHQDNAYFNLPEGTPVTGVWIALDQATPENGCMHFVPGSHRDGPVVHFKRRDWQICDTDILGRPCVAAPVEPGDCIIFDGLVHHGTPHNPTNTRRRSLQFHYVPEGTPKTDDADRLRVFGSEGKNVTC